jgi:hypothetical protein
MWHTQPTQNNNSRSYESARAKIHFLTNAVFRPWPEKLEQLHSGDQSFWFRLMVTTDLAEVSGMHYTAA